MIQTYETITRMHQQEILESVHVHHLETRQLLEFWRTLRQRFNRIRKTTVPVNPEACLC
jgi:hypothetical protein